MLCAEVTEALMRLTACAETEEGTRVATHCLYPNFAPVNVFVAKVGDGFKVHDGAGAARAAWGLGRDDAGVKRTLRQHAEMHHLAMAGDAMVAEAASSDWLVSAILAVANASAAAATAVAERAAVAAEDRLRERVEAVLETVVPEPSRLARGYEVVGRSGKTHTFDFAVRRRMGQWLLVGAVTPHHTSIFARYVAFADTNEDNDIIHGRFAVYERPLQDEDAALMQQVADLVPFASLPRGVKRELLT